MDGPAARRGRVLGVDLGIQRTGLALSDELGLSTRGLPNLTPRSRKEDVEFLVGLAREHGVVDFAIGLPLQPRSGDESSMSRRARGFAAALDDALKAAGLDVVVHLIDERGTSKEAARRLVQSDVRKGRRKDLLDSEAARLLAEEVLARRR
jgi:putative Holliday junction resolvase